MGTKKLAESSMVAPCGMNCALCLAYQRPVNRCFGCITEGFPKMNYCARCAIRNCDSLKKIKSKYCFKCSKYPCRLVRYIDKRYRVKYSMSMIENLNTIKNIGIRRFIRLEKEKWKCRNCGSILCVHRESCMACGTQRTI